MPTPQQLAQQRKKLTIAEVEEQFKPSHRVIASIAMDDDSVVEVGFRYPKHLEVQAFAAQIPAAGAIKAQIGLLRMLCLTHDPKELDELFDQQNGTGFIVAVATECMRLINDGVGVEIKKG